MYVVTQIVLEENIGTWASMGGMSTYMQGKRIVQVSKSNEKNNLGPFALKCVKKREKICDL